MRVNINLFRKAAVAVVICALCARPRGWAKSSERTVQFRQSGSFQTVPLDLDSDNTSDLSGFGIDSGKNSLGPYTDQTVSETDPELNGTGCSGPPPFDTHGVSCTFPDGRAGCKFAGVGGADVFRFDDSGDLLFANNELGPACLNFSNGLMISTGSGAITGGTGKLSGATGTISFKSQSAPLTFDSAGHAFGWFTASGTIKLAR